MGWTWGKKEWCCWGLPSSHLSQTLRKAVQSRATLGQSIRPCWGDWMVKLWQSFQLEVTPICSNCQHVAHSYLYEPGLALCRRCSIICWCNTSSGSPIFEEFSFVLVARLFYFCLQCSLSWENNQRNGTSAEDTTGLLCQFTWVPCLLINKSRAEDPSDSLQLNYILCFMTVLKWIQ